MSRISRFTSSFVKTDVTSVKLVDKYIFAGIGDTLHVFHTTDSTFVQKVKIFNGANIHGIYLNKSESYILTYAGCNIATVYCELDRSPPLNSSCESRTGIKDWILSAIWLKNDQIGAVVMQNKLNILDKNLEILRVVECTEKSILYSAFLCQQSDSLIIISGTVFGELIIWSDEADTKALKVAGHKGAIFSIDYKDNLITSTSDDRSVILWSHEGNNTLSKELKSTRKVTLEYQLFGHESRVFYTKITDNHVVTCGEDSTVNLWNFQGELVKTLKPHTSGSVWCCDYNKGTLVTGSANAGIVKFDFTLNPHAKSLVFDEVPVKVAVLQGGNLVIFGKIGGLYQYDISNGANVKIAQLDELKSYNLMEVSVCRRMVALCGYKGEIYIYKLGKNCIELEEFYQTPCKSRISSFHWLSCNSFLTLQTSKLHLWSLTPVKLMTSFTAPHTTTSACQTVDAKHIITGDRKGNIHLYSLQHSNPVQTLKKQLNYLGVTQVTNDNDTIICLGRNGTFLRFAVKDDQLFLISSVILPFQWLGAYDCGHVVGFHGNSVVFYDVDDRKKLLQLNCGGGHRSWSFMKYKSSSVFAYLKDKTVKVVTMNDRCVTNVAQSTHSNVINCMRTLQIADQLVLISASEDTDLHIMTVDSNLTAVNVAIVLSAHLSSVRCVAWCKTNDDYVIFSGGGRGQIVSWMLFRHKSRIFCTKQHSFSCDIEQDVRVMDLVVFTSYLFAACSDGTIKMFEIHRENNVTIKLVKNVKYKQVCVLKLGLVEVMSCSFLVSTATDGVVVFWHIPNGDVDAIESLQTFKIHQSGINSLSTLPIGNDRFLCVTGGDDNKLAVTLFKFRTETMSLEKITEYCNTGSHCAQITGICITDSYLLTTSVDQKVLFFKWDLSEDTSGIVCQLLDRFDSSVADIQGMECLDCDQYFTIIVYGKGYEFIKCKKS